MNLVGRSTFSKSGSVLVKMTFLEGAKHDSANGTTHELRNSRLTGFFSLVHVLILVLQFRSGQAIW